MHEAEVSKKWHKKKLKWSKKRAANRQKAKLFWETKKKEDQLELVRSENEKQNCDENTLKPADIVKIKNQSATTKKVQLFQSVTNTIVNKTKYDTNSDTNQYVIINTNCLRELVKESYCQACDMIQPVNFEVGMNFGYAAELLLKCNECSAVVSKAMSSARINQSKKSAFQINKDMVNAFLKNGCGHSGLLNFSETLNMNTMSLSSYYLHLTAIKKEFEVLKEKVLLRSREIVRQVYNSNDNELINIAASFDGSWPKRGHTSLFGFAAVIEILTGLVVDFQVMSKYCRMCVTTANELGVESPEYDIWIKGHKSSSECDMNYSGSSGGMEAVAAELMWKRSVSQGNMQYTTLVSDGDSKTLKHLNDLNIYSVPVVKEECINHVHKRLKTALLQLVKTEKAKGVTLGGKKRGALTEPVITKLAMYYRCAIVRNKTDIKAMRKDILSTLTHCSSTDDKPIHNDCPEGEKSWCFYQRAIAKQETPPSHSTMKVVLSEKVVQYVKPIYDRLASEDLLKRCTKGITQNTNECLHSVIWRKCPKHVFINRDRIEIGATQAVSLFNMGHEETVKQLLPENAVASNTMKIVKARDRKRKRDGDYQNQSSEKRLRSVKKTSKKKIDVQKVRLEGGPSYGAGLFL